jgi:hypothetical protein
MEIYERKKGEKGERGKGEREVLEVTGAGINRVDLSISRREEGNSEWVDCLVDVSPPFRQVRPV